MRDSFTGLAQAELVQVLCTNKGISTIWRLQTYKKEYKNCYAESDPESCLQQQLAVNI